MVIASQSKAADVAESGLELGAYADLTLRGARLRFGCSATASADSSSLDDPAAAVAVFGGLRASRLFFRASMMSITGAMCGSGVSTTLWPSTFASIIWRRFVL